MILSPARLATEAVPKMSMVVADSQSGRPFDEVTALSTESFDSFTKILGLGCFIAHWADQIHAVVQGLHFRSGMGVNIGVVECEILKKELRIRCG